MKVLVCISHVPDTTAKIVLSADNKEVVSQGMTYIINPYDEIALARALELTDGGKGTVSVVTVGDPSVEPTLRKALAIGANDAFRVNAVPVSASFVAVQIASLAREHTFDLILCGRESSDYNGSSVPGMLGALLEIPSVTFAKKIQVENGTAIIEREIEGGKEILEGKLPIVAGASEGMAEPKIPNMRGIMSARTKPLVVVEPVEANETVRTVLFDKPESRNSVKMIPAEEAGSLWDLLREEKKVL